MLEFGCLKGESGNFDFSEMLNSCRLCWLSKDSSHMQSCRSALSFKPSYLLTAPGLDFEASFRQPELNRYGLQAWTLCFSFTFHEAIITPTYGISNIFRKKLWNVPQAATLCNCTFLLCLYNQQQYNIPLKKTYHFKSLCYWFLSFFMGKICIDSVCICLSKCPWEIK